MTKLQITLTDEETQLLAMRGGSMGYDVTKYAKYVLAREAIDGVYGVPTFRTNARMEKAIKEGLEEYRRGKTKTWPLGKYDNSRNK